MPYKEKLAEAVVDIKANTKNYEQGVSRIKGSLKGLAVAAGVAFAAKKLFDFGKASVKVASEFNETRQRFDIIFKGIGDQADAAAKKISKSFDLADGSTKTMLADTGDLLTSLGFTKEKSLEMSAAIGTLAGDVASFKDVEGGAARAAFMMTKAMIGQTKSVRNQLKYAVSLDKEHNARVKTMMALTGETLKVAKAQDVFNQLIKLSKNAVGDYERTASSFANQQRAMNEQFIQLKDSTGQAIIKFIAASRIMFKLKTLFVSLNDKIIDLASSGKFEEWGILVAATYKHIVAMTTFAFKAMDLVAKAFWNDFMADTKFFGQKIGRTLANLINDTDFDINDITRDITMSAEEVEAAFDKMAKKYKETTDLIQSNAIKQSIAIAAAAAKDRRASKNTTKEIIANERAVQKEKGATFSNAEDILRLAQKDAGGTKLGLKGGVNAAAVKPQEQATTRSGISKTQEVLSEILSTIKIGNKSLSNIEKNTAGDGNPIFV